MVYSDIDINKKAFVFELDNVLYPEKDYLLQVYYLFAGFMEYTELLDTRVLLKLMTDTYNAEGPEAVFNTVQDKFKIDEKYAANFQHLMLNAKLPLPLILYPEMLTLLQEIVVDRKQLYIITTGDPQLQLNKIKQTEWHGMGEYLTCYFLDEYNMGTAEFISTRFFNEHDLEAKDIVIIGKGAERGLAFGADTYYDVESFLTSH